MQTRGVWHFFLEMHSNQLLLNSVKTRICILTLFSCIVTAGFAQQRGLTFVGAGVSSEHNVGYFGANAQLERTWRVGNRLALGVGVQGFATVYQPDDFLKEELPDKNEYVRSFSLDAFVKRPLYKPARRGGAYLLAGPSLLNEFSQNVVFARIGPGGVVRDWRQERTQEWLRPGVRVGLGYEWANAGGKLRRVELGARSHTLFPEPNYLTLNFLLGL